MTIADRDKVREIQACFSAVIGEKFIRYETAELLLSDDTWNPWQDLPIRLHTHTGKLISIAWSQFDDLWIANDSSLPFSVDVSTTRWVSNSVEKINAALGATIKSVMLGQDEMSIEGSDIRIWTRLLIQVDEHWLEIFNALDENGYDFHTERPIGTFITCV